MRAIELPRLAGGLAFMAGLALLAACASAGREVHQGVRYYPAADEGEEGVERWQASWQDVPIFIVMEGDFGVGVRGPRAFAIRDAVLDRRPGRHDLFQIVGPGDLVAGDTLGGLLWRPEEYLDRECGMYGVVPGDSIRPTEFPCSRVETEVRESWRPTLVQRTVWEVGGNAVLLVGEDYSGRFRGLRGYALRCRDVEGTPTCRP